MLVPVQLTKELAIGHPNVITIYGKHRIDRGDTMEGLILMELADKTLLDYLKETNDNRLTEKNVLGLLLPICKGLQHLHSKGITHRDFKA